MANLVTFIVWLVMAIPLLVMAIPLLVMLAWDGIRYLCGNKGALRCR